MLVVARKQHEFIQIGEDIIVKVIKTSKGSVKIGIDAPGGTRVLRGELSLADLGLENLSLDDEEHENDQPRARPRRDQLKANSDIAKMKAIGAV